MDQRGGDGRFNGWFAVIAISWGQEIREFWNAEREDRLSFEHRAAGKPLAPEISSTLFPCYPGIRISFFLELVV